MKVFHRYLELYFTTAIILEWKHLLKTDALKDVVIEAKIDSVTTHDSITYSQKAQTHKNVHPYLRYGILIGNRAHYPLPGRLFRHGQHFDFMVSWKAFEAEKEEWTNLMEILKLEIKASKALEEVIFNSRSKNREKYTILHRPLNLKS